MDRSHGWSIVLMIVQLQWWKSPWMKICQLVWFHQSKHLNKEKQSSKTNSFSVKDILGYTRNEMIGNWFGRYLSVNDLEKFEDIRQRYCKISFWILLWRMFVGFLVLHEGQQTATSVCDIFDIYGNNGEDRLTFLCQIRPVRERRAKTVKFQVIAQLIE